jgi:hypothetical protein
VRASSTSLSKAPAIAFDACLVGEAARWEQSKSRLLMQTQALYTTSLAALLREGFDLDRGHGRQIALPLAAWRRIAPGEPVQLELLP